MNGTTGSDVLGYKLKELSLAKMNEAEILAAAHKSVTSMSTELADKDQELRALRARVKELESLETEAKAVKQLLSANVWKNQTLTEVVADYKDRQAQERQALEAKFGGK